MLEVIALSVDDAREALRGGADRIELVGTMASDGLSPSCDLVKQIQDSVDIPVRVMVRTEAGFGTSEPEHLMELAHLYDGLGVDGLVLGYLDNGKIDVDLMQRLIAGIGVEYTFHRAVDHADDYARALSDITRIGGRLTSILTGGSPKGVGENISKLARYAGTYGDLMLIGGGLSQDDVRPLKDAGLRHFHVGSKVRPGGDFSRTVDAHLVEQWKALTD